MSYQTIVADPPWQYRNKLDMSDGVNRSAMSHYKTLPLEKVKTFLLDTPGSVIHRETPWIYPEDRCLADCIADDAHLWLWVTNPFLIDGSGTDVARAWGFEPKALVTWVKGRLTITGSQGPKLVLNIGMGRYLRGCTEHMIFAVRGKAAAMVKDHGVPNVFVAPRTKHSAKPKEAFDIVQRTSPGRKLSIFEREPRAGFDVIGDEIEDTNSANAA